MKNARARYQGSSQATIITIAKRQSVMKNTKVTATPTHKSKYFQQTSKAIDTSFSTEDQKEFAKSGAFSDEREHALHESQISTIQPGEASDVRRCLLLPMSTVVIFIILCWERTICAANPVKGLEASYSCYWEHHEGVVHFRYVDLAPDSCIGLDDLQPWEAAQGHRLPHNWERCRDHCLQDSLHLSGCSPFIGSL